MEVIIEGYPPYIGRENITDSIKNGSGIRVPSLRIKGNNKNDLIGFVDLEI